MSPVTYAVEHAETHGTTLVITTNQPHPSNWFGTQGGRGLVAETAERTGQPLAQPAETIARFFLAGFDGLTTQRLALAGGRLDLVSLPSA